VADGGELRAVIPVGGAVARIFAITCLNRVIPVFATLDEALAPRPGAMIRALRPRPPSSRRRSASLGREEPVTGPGFAGHRPGAAASAITGGEVADVMALAQADSRDHGAVSRGPTGRDTCHCAAAKPTPQPGSFVPMNVPGTGFCTTGR
jgi:hypothetical protein